MIFVVLKTGVTAATFTVNSGGNSVWQTDKNLNYKPEKDEDTGSTC